MGKLTGQSVSDFGDALSTLIRTIGQNAKQAKEKEEAQNQYNQWRQIFTRQRPEGEGDVNQPGTKTSPNMGVDASALADLVGRLAGNPQANQYLSAGDLLFKDNERRMGAGANAAKTKALLDERKQNDLLDFYKGSANPVAYPSIVDAVLSNQPVPSFIPQPGFEGPVGGGNNAPQVSVFKTEMKKPDDLLMSQPITTDKGTFIPILNKTKGKVELTNINDLAGGASEVYKTGMKPKQKTTGSPGKKRLTDAKKMSLDEKRLKAGQAMKETDALMQSGDTNKMASMLSSQDQALLNSLSSDQQKKEFAKSKLQAHKTAKEAEYNLFTKQLAEHGEERSGQPSTQTSQQPSAPSNKAVGAYSGKPLQSK